VEEGEERAIAAVATEISEGLPGLSVRRGSDSTTHTRRVAKLFALSDGSFYLLAALFSEFVGRRIRVPRIIHRFQMSVWTYSISPEFTHLGTARTNYHRGRVHTSVWASFEEAKLA
jgi:hypothetical protein